MKELIDSMDRNTNVFFITRQLMESLRTNAISFKEYDRYSKQLLRNAKRLKLNTKI
jgi:hypothetical protein